MNKALTILMAVFMIVGALTKNIPMEILCGFFMISGMIIEHDERN